MELGRRHVIIYRHSCEAHGELQRAARDAAGRRAAGRCEDQSRGAPVLKGGITAH